MSKAYILRITAGCKCSFKRFTNCLWSLKCNILGTYHFYIVKKTVIHVHDFEFEYINKNELRKINLLEPFCGRFTWWIHKCYSLSPIRSS